MCRTSANNSSEACLARDRKIFAVNPKENRKGRGEELFGTVGNPNFAVLTLSHYLRAGYRHDPVRPLRLRVSAGNPTFAVLTLSPYLRAGY